MFSLKRKRLLNFVKTEQFKCMLRSVKHESSCSESNTFAVKERFAFSFCKDVEEGFLKDKFKARHHPGVMNIKCVELPSPLLQAIDKIRTGKYSASSLLKDANKLAMYINNRQPPVEEDELRQMLDSIAVKLIKKGKLNFSVVEEGSEKDYDDLSDTERKKLRVGLKREVYNWKPIEFDEYMAFVYLMARLAPDYASLTRIFAEIKKRRKDFRPSTMFDFGSGVGSVYWAVDSVWPEECKEVYNVDSSGHMNALAELLLKGGDANNPGPQKLINTYYRQFLPASNNIKYNLVVSSRTLFELGDLNNRIRTADILWKKVLPGGFLVFVENSSKKAYQMLLEIRDYLLEICKIEREKYSINSPIHVFSPCPHDQFCPRFHHRSNTSCHFSVKYNSFMKGTALTDHFSYVVLQKDERNQEQWPRVVEPVLKRHNHVIMRTCTPGASVRELVATKKLGASCYKMCKRTSWGDFVPVTVLNDGDQFVSDDCAKATDEDDGIKGENILNNSETNLTQSESTHTIVRQSENAETSLCSQKTS